MKSIIAGLVLIGIGFAMGGSVFKGDFDLWNIFFDGLGLFWIVKGSIQIYRNRNRDSSQ
jgi:hypothetical protein